jgi:transposase-like protein
MTKRSPFRDFKMPPEIIRLAVMMSVRLPFSLRNVADLLRERAMKPVAMGRKKVDVCRLTTWRKFYGYRLHPDRNRKAEQGRSTGVAHMGSGTHC